jgi:homoaconitase/3-isopropylmalate dehydratase large subunit
MAASACSQLGVCCCPLIETKAKLKVNRGGVAHTTNRNAGVVVSSALISIDARLSTIGRIPSFAFAVGTIDLTQRLRILPTLAAHDTIRTIELGSRSIL